MLETPDAHYGLPPELTPALFADLMARLSLLEQALRDEREKRLASSQQPVVVLPTYEPVYPTATPTALIFPNEEGASSGLLTGTEDPTTLANLRVAVQEWQYRYEVLWQEHQQARRAIQELQQKIMSIPL